MIACIRKGDLMPNQYARYMKQIEVNQSYIRKWVSVGAYMCVWLES